MSDTRFAIALAITGLIIIGLGMGFTSELSSSQSVVLTQQAQIQSLQKQVQGLNSSSGSMSQSEQAQIQTLEKSLRGPNSSDAYKLTLVITSNDVWNSTTTAPRYWVLTSKGLESAVNINLPAHTLIQLTLIDLDTPSPLPSQFSQVSGTVGNEINVMNITATSQNPTNATDNRVVNFLNANTEIGHTFTVPQLGINIPSAANSVEVADFYVNQTGTFVWHCEDPCGFGPSGWLGPMGANGWMGGTITVT